MKLETERLILRPLVIGDHKDIQKHFPHWDIVKYLPKSLIEWPYPADGAYRFLSKKALPAMERGDEWFWAITSKENPDELLGVVQLRRDSTSGNRRLWLAAHAQGKGYMTEALDAINDYAFDVLGFDKLLVKNAHENQASHKLKEKTGAELLQIVTVPENHYMNGCREQEIWQLTKEAWRAYKQQQNNALKQAKEVLNKPLATTASTAFAPKAAHRSKISTGVKNLRTRVNTLFQGRKNTPKRGKKPGLGIA